MRFVKLNAIDSTNDFLKKLSQTESVENFTVVSTETQTKGRGQMGSVWVSESGKNLIMSVLIKEVLGNVQSIFQLNAAVAVAVIAVLERHAIPKLSVKWPNDIMSGNKKIGGILIENSLKDVGNIESIVGIGLNVNQTNFELLPQASSLALVSGKTFEIDILLVEIAQALKENTARLDLAWQLYTEKLFKKDVPMAFQDQQGLRFMGIVIGVASDGKLKIQMEDGSFQTFGIKEIQMLYWTAMLVHHLDIGSQKSAHVYLNSSIEFLTVLILTKYPDFPHLGCIFIH